MARFEVITGPERRRRWSAELDRWACRFDIGDIENLPISASGKTYADRLG
jgi:hypothetical protein